MISFKQLYESANFKGITLYHGTNKEFDKFDPKMMGRTDSGFMGKGFYLTSIEVLAKAYADNSTSDYGGESTVMKFRINAKKTLEMETTGDYSEAMEKAGVKTKDRAKMNDELKKLGYDSIAVVKSGRIREFIALDHSVYKRIK